MKATHQAGDLCRIVLVEDHPIVRQGTRTMVEQHVHFEVIGEASNADDGVALVALLKPDLVIMDIQMKGPMDGINATGQIKREHPCIAVLMLTSYEKIDYVLEALRVGAAGYLLKEATVEQLHDTITAVIEGNAAIDPRLAQRLLKKIAEERHAGEGPSSMCVSMPPPLPPSSSPIDVLTRRELEILQEVALIGGTNLQVATRLHLSPATVKGHVANIISKLGVSDRTQASVKAMRLGIILA